MKLTINMTFQADLVMYVNTDLQPHTVLTHIQYNEKKSMRA
jgi:hypothetical protein